MSDFVTREGGHQIAQLAEGDLPFCGSCGAAVMPEGHRGHLMYGAWLSYRDFELILLSLGASGSDVQRLWPEAVDDDGCTYLPLAFPLATRDDLLDELARVDRQLDNPGAGRTIDHEQLAAYRARLQQTRRQVLDQLARTEAA